MNITPYSHNAAAHGGTMSPHAVASPTQQVSKPVSLPNQQTTSSGDKVTISDEGKHLSRQVDGSNGKNTDKAAPSTGSQHLSAEDLQQLKKLKARDSEVRAHEQAHLSTAGRYAKGTASFTLQKGPDGNSYAIGGEVGIDLSSESTPEETIEKMRTIRRAALAPASPSGADRRIAGQASVKEARARQEQMVNRQEELLAAENAGNSSSPENKATAVEDNTSEYSGISFTTLQQGISAYARNSAL